jgi:uncharacterized membrane protein
MADKIVKKKAVDDVTSDQGTNADKLAYLKAGSELIKQVSGSNASENTDTTSSMVNNAASMAVAGATVGGVPGAVAGGVIGGVTGALGASAARKQARAKAESDYHATMGEIEAKKSQALRDVMAQMAGNIGRTLTSNRGVSLGK